MLEQRLCATCGKPLTKKQLKKRPNAKYCSSTCWGKRKRDFAYDDSFLNDPTAFAGYFIGLFIADGSNSKTDGTIRIELKDEQLIDDLIKNTNYHKTKGIHDRRHEGKGIYYAITYAGDVSRSITSMGFPRGSKLGIVFIPNFITEVIFRDCLRGIIDGDGGFDIEKKYGYLRCSISNMGKGLLETIHAHLLNKGIVKGGALNETRPNFYKLHFGHIDSVSIGDYIYYDTNLIKLERKYENYLKGKQYIIKQEPTWGAECSVLGCGHPARSKSLCKYHYDKRYQKEHREEIAATNKIYREEHKEEISKQKKQYRDANKDKIKKRDKEWYAENKDEVLERRRKRDAENREELREQKRVWRENNRAKINAQKRDNRQENLEKTREQEKERYHKNLERKRAQNKASYERNKEKRLAKAAKYREENREKIRERDKAAYAADPEKFKKRQKELRK